jgi:hypothetical protein
MPDRALSICARVCWSSWPPGVAAEPPDGAAVGAELERLAGTEATGDGAVDVGADPDWAAGTDWAAGIDWAAPDWTGPDWTGPD